MYSRLLVPVSFEEDRDPVRSLDVARLLADDGAQVTLLHVIEEIPAYAMAEALVYTQERRGDVKARMTALAETVPGCDWVIVDGHAARSILEEAGKRAVDCIVIASHRPGFQDMFLGSTAAHVVRHAEASVHVVR